MKGKSLYQNSVTCDLWNDNFLKVELTEIMRQKEDGQFAEALNRLRVRKKHDKLREDDITLLKSRETGEDWSDAVHIYPCNKQVDEYNVKTLFAKCVDCMCILAKDLKKDERSGNMKCAEIKIKKSSYTTLSKSLWLGIGARVMLTRNIDVSDGLVNGVVGTVHQISTLPDQSSPSCIKVQFDNKCVGLKLKRQSSDNQDVHVHVVPIEIVEETVNKQYVRRQFPLKLAWACTVHKVQGITTDRAVVCLDRIFSAGQAYVGLSRVTSLKGLQIEGFNEKCIYCNEGVINALSKMASFIDDNDKSDNELVQDDSEVEATCHSENTTIMLHNIQGLHAHQMDFKCNNEMMSSDFICLTETWTDKESYCDLDMIDFKWYHQPRCLSYDNFSRLTEILKEQSNGGVAVCGRKDRVFCRLNMPVTNLEYIAFQIISQVSLTVVVIYRPPSYVLKVLLNGVHKVSNKCIIMGDFNEDIFKQSSCIEKVMQEHGYKQCVTEATTERGTLIDHVYVRNIDSIHTHVVPTYYSYHESVAIKF